jgi:cytochrome b
MRIWDASTRLFHWSLVVLVATSTISISLADGPNALVWMRVHVASGETLMAMLIFRLVWGVIGSDTSRFVTFLKSPLLGLRHLAHIARREPDLAVGHNPAGGWMVVAMLGLLALQVATGLFSNDDGSTEGPLAKYIRRDLSDTLSGLHGAVFNVLMGAVILHVCAIVAYAVLKRHDLVSPMITGKKRLPAATRAPQMAGPISASAVWLVAAAIAVLVSRL